MPQLIFLPHAERCPDGAVIDAKIGDVLIDVAPLTVLILNMRARWPAPVRPVMSFLGRV